MIEHSYGVAAESKYLRIYVKELKTIQNLSSEGVITLK